jgi:hypothetical protein
MKIKALRARHGAVVLRQKVSTTMTTDNKSQLRKMRGRVRGYQDKRPIEERRAIFDNDILMSFYAVMWHGLA